MDFFKITGEVFGYLAILCMLLIYVSVNRSRILKVKIVTDSLFLLNQFFLGMMTGAALYAVAISRSAIFYQRGRRKWADTPLWLVFFILLTLISPILTWAGPISLLPTVGSIICVFSYYVTNTILLRVLSFFGEGLWLVYGLLSGSRAVAIAGVIALVSIGVGMLNEWHHHRKQKKHPSLNQMD